MLFAKSGLKSKILFLLLGVIIIISTGGAIYVMGETSQKSSIPKIAEKSFAVRAYIAKKLNVRPKRVFYGSSVARTRLELRSQVGGVIVEHMDNFITGSKINKGELIVRLEDFDYKNIESAYMLAIDKSVNVLSELKVKIKQAEKQSELEQEQLNIAQRDFDRAKKLFDSKIISQREVEVRQKALNGARQAVNRILYDLQTLKINAKNIQNDIKGTQIEIKKARKNIERTVIKAPFDAYIYEPEVGFGQQIKLGEKITTLIDINHADVEFTISKRLYGSILAAGEKIVGRDVTIIDNLGNHEIRYQAQIVTVSPQASPQTGGIKVRASIKDGLDDNKPRFNPGDFVKVEILDRVFKNVFEVEQAAIYQGNKIYSIDSDSRLREHLVEIQTRQGDNVIISSDTIREGMTIASSNFVEASRGILVKIVN